MSERLQGAVLQVKRHLEFADQLVKDKAELSARCERLVDDLRALERRYDERAAEADDKAQREMKRQREGLLAAERIRREAWMQVASLPPPRSTLNRRPPGRGARPARGCTRARLFATASLSPVGDSQHSLALSSGSLLCAAVADPAPIGEFVRIVSSCAAAASPSDGKLAERFRGLVSVGSRSESCACASSVQG